MRAYQVYVKIEDVDHYRLLHSFRFPFQSVRNDGCYWIFY